jgi:precorrin-6B C5,15-methyltransferase / cobalt-precorrin-6B C5,C15-methyltransferase
VISVVGIGADGWAGLSDEARDAVLAADVVVGSARQLALVPETVASRRTWPSPIAPLVDELVAGTVARQPCVLASGDPMLHGIGTTLARRVGRDRIRVFPQVSTFSIACARLAWDAANVELVSLVARPVETVVARLAPARQLVVYVDGCTGAAKLASTLCDHGYGQSRFVVLEQLGGERELVTDTVAAEWGDRDASGIHCVAVGCDPTAAPLAVGATPGLPDAAYESEGQITKWVVRAATLAALRPLPHQLLWDVGAGSGSIGIEWLRAEPTARATAVEPRADRAERVRRNALALGVPRLTVVEARAPECLTELATPDAVFIGGGITADGMIDTCWNALEPGGRLAANAVTLEGVAVLQEASTRYGGSLARIGVEHAEPIGGFTAWRPQIAVTQWSVRR